MFKTLLLIISLIILRAFIAFCFEMLVEYLLSKNILVNLSENKLDECAVKVPEF